MLAYSYEMVLVVSCIVSAFVGYSLGEYFTKRDIDKKIDKLKDYYTQNKEKDDK